MGTRGGWVKAWEGKGSGGRLAVFCNVLRHGIVLRYGAEPSNALTSCRFVLFRVAEMVGTVAFVPTTPGRSLIRAIRALMARAAQRMAGRRPAVCRGSEVVPFPKCKA